MKAYLIRVPVLLFAIFCGLLAGVASAADSAPRERLLMDSGWKFHLGNDWGISQNLAKAGSGYGPTTTMFSDASWRRVDLPHDWAIELPFDRKADGAHGFRAVGSGFLENSIAWYRRTFSLPQSDAGRRLWLELDGVYRDSLVYGMAGASAAMKAVTAAAATISPMWPIAVAIMSWLFGWMPRKRRAGSTRGPASTGMCGW